MPRPSVAGHQRFCETSRTDGGRVDVATDYVPRPSARFSVKWATSEVYATTRLWAHARPGGLMFGRVGSGTVSGLRP